MRGLGEVIETVGYLKLCGACAWHNHGFCSSLKVMAHIKRETGESRTYLVRGAGELPLLKDCFWQKESPVLDTPGPRAQIGNISARPNMTHKLPSPVDLVEESYLPTHKVSTAGKAKKTRRDAADINQLVIDFGEVGISTKN